MNSLRTRLFGAIALTVAICVALTVSVGIVLTRRAVDRSALLDLSHQADLIAGSQTKAFSPFTHLPDLQPYLHRQNESYQVSTEGLPDASVLALHKRGPRTARSTASSSPRGS